jgi:AcrR family transcriptional regulator
MRTALTRETRRYLGNKQAIRILDAAREVFVREGTTAFSARRVAKAAGLSLGSVQHVFPTTNQLLAAMIVHVRDSYDAAYRSLEQRLPFSAEERLGAVIDYLVADICKKDTRHFFLGFWALSCHNPLAYRSLCEAYDWQVKHVAGFIASARPQLSDDQLLEKARHISALIEGTMLFVGMAERKLNANSPMIVSLREQIWSMINDGARARPVGAKTASRRRGRAALRRTAAAVTSV